MYLMLLSVNDVNSFIHVQYRFNFVQSFNLSCIWAYLIVNTCWVQFYAQSHCPYYDHMLNQKSQNRTDQPTRGWLFYFRPIKSKEKDNFFILIFMVRWGKCTIIIGIDIKEPYKLITSYFYFLQNNCPICQTLLVCRQWLAQQEEVLFSCDFLQQTNSWWYKFSQISMKRKEAQDQKQGTAPCS